MKKALLYLMGILLLLLMSVDAHAYIVYSQLPLQTSSSGLVSSPDPFFGNPERVYDNFTLSSTYPITGITWWGLYSAQGSSDPASFAITIYGSTKNGRPAGSSAATINYGSLTIEPYLVGADPTVTISKYTITLVTPFDAQADTKYWLSIYNTLGNSLWGWQQSNPYGDGSIQDPPEFIEGGYNTPSNVAFELISSPVPIPTAGWLLGAGLIALVVIRRRIRK